MPDHILDSIIEPSRVLFYPSSCQYSDEFQRAPYDAVILNSEGLPREQKRGKVYCTKYDNNEILGMFHARGIKLAAIIVIRDGCVEGGNYECVAREGFFGRLMPVIAQQFDFFFDSHRALPEDTPLEFHSMPNPDYLARFIQMSEPIKDVKSYHVKILPPIERVMTLGKVKTRIIRDSIWNGFRESDLLVIRAVGSSWQSSEKYLQGLRNEKDLSEKCEFIKESRVRSIEKILNKAAEKEATRVSVMPFAKGAYCQIAKEIQNWQGEFPKEICFYHLNADDYQTLRANAN